MITAGIDCGAKTTKTVILKNVKIIGKGIVLTGFDQEKSIKASLEASCADAGIKVNDIEKFGGTGAGRNSIKGAEKINDIKAIGKAANYFFQNARMVIDVGAEEARVVKLDGKGNAFDFAINEKCAAGSGTFIESMSRALEIPLDDMGPLANMSEKEIPLNAQCVIFAESEVIGLIHGKTERKDISKAIHDAVAGRIISMVRRIGVSEDIVMIGGVAYNPGFVEAMKRHLGIAEILIPENPEIGSAVGAALVVAE